MFYFGAVCFFSYVSFKAVVLFEPTCPINTVLLFTLLFYCIVSVSINKIFIHSFRAGQIKRHYLTFFACSNLTDA